MFLEVGHVDISFMVTSFFAAGHHDVGVPIFGATDGRDWCFGICSSH